MFHGRRTSSACLRGTRKDKRGFDLISDALPFGGLWYLAVSDAIGYAQHYSRAHDAVIHLRMDVGRWGEPELHARNRRGWRSRWRHHSFSARLRFARIGWLAAQIGLLSRFVS